MLRSSAVCCVVLCACSEEASLGLPPLEFFGGRAKIGVSTPEAYPLCAGDLVHVDQQIARVEARLGVMRESPAEVYLLSFEEIDQVCSIDDVLGCYVHGRDIVATTWQSIDHELVHAVAQDMQFPSLFWAEGAAELLSGGTTRKDIRVTLHAEDLETQTLITYLSAAHFSRFLVETRGWDAYVRVVSGAPLEDVYGMAAAALTAAYERDAPYAYPPLDPCPYPPLAQTEEGVWSEDFILSCASAEATQFELAGGSRSSGAAVVRRLDVVAGTYQFEVEGEAELVALGCHTEVLASRPTVPSSGALFNEIDFAPGTVFAAGEPHVLDIPAGAYRLVISGSQVGPVSASLRVSRVP